mmetsp:Transcript_27224/g.63423  ORF Transcript_27224/g.63423 Transcript_27224/m.63423 type:complete len:915 (-) Transcript_27224:69-2813(-)
MPRRVAQDRGLFDSEADFIEPEEPVIVEPGAEAFGEVALGARLDEAVLYDLADEVEKARSAFGPDDMRTAEAFSRYDAELSVWRAAATEAANAGDLVEMERLSNTAELVSSMVSIVDDFSTAAGSAQASSRKKRDKPPGEKKEKKKKDKSSKAPKLEGAGIGSFDDVAWPSGDFAAWDASAGANEQVGMEASSSAAWPRESWTNPPAPHESWGSVPAPQESWGSAAPALQESWTGAQGPHGQETAHSAAPKVQQGAWGSASAPAPDLDAQLRVLQASNQDLQTKLTRTEDDLQAAKTELSKARAELKDANSKLLAEEADKLLAEDEADGGQRKRGKKTGDKSGASAMSPTMQDVHKQLQAELDSQQHELNVFRQRLADAEQQVIDKDHMLSQARQRLFKERARSSELQEQLKAASAYREALQQQWDRQLEKEREKQAAVERELLCLQHAVDTTSTLRAAVPASRRALSASGLQSGRTTIVGNNSQPVRPRGSVPTSRGLAQQSANQPPAAHNPEVEQSPRGTRQTAVPPSALNDHHQGPCSEPERLAGGRTTETLTAPPTGIDPSGEEPMVPEDDELSGTVTELKSIRLGPLGSGALEDFSLRSRERAVAEQASSSLLPRTSAEEWAMTPRVSVFLPVVLARTPSLAPQWLSRTAANYRSLLIRAAGHFYEDEYILLQLASHSDPADRGRCNFEINIVNKSAHVLQHVALLAGEQPQFASLLVRIDPTPGASHQGHTLWPKQNLTMRGYLEALGPFEYGPEVVLSYLLPDNLCCKASLRLPLTVTKFLEPAKLVARGFVDLWESEEFTRGEVAFVGAVREDFLRPGGLFYLQQGLQLNDCFAFVSGVDGSPQSSVYAARYVLASSGLPTEVLLRVEFGSPDGERGLLRVTVRSASYIVNRGVGQAVLDAVCSPS